MHESLRVRRFSFRRASVESMAALRGALPRRVNPLQPDDRGQRTGRERIGLLDFRRQRRASGLIVAGFQRDVLVCMANAGNFRFLPASSKVTR
jgi:hypothetical protein